MKNIDKAQKNITELCSYLKEHNDIPSRKENKYLSGYFSNLKNALQGRNTMKIYDFIPETIKEYDVERFFKENVVDIQREARVKELQEFINTHKRIPLMEEPERTRYEIYRKYLDLSVVTTSPIEFKGLERLTKILDEFDTMPRPINRRLSKECRTSLMTFKMAKAGIKKNIVHSASYDEMCEKRGYPGLLEIREKKTKTNKKTNRYTVFYTETSQQGSHQATFPRMRHVHTYDIKYWLEKNNIVADFVIDGIREISKDWDNG